MALVLVPKENTRVPEKVFRQDAPGSYIVRYVTGKNDMRINKDLIMEILESVGIDVGGDPIHKVRLNGASFIVDNAGLTIVTS